MNKLKFLEETLERNILVLDGGLGTMIQKHKFTESDFRGREFINHPKPLAGFNDILNLTKPSYIVDIHKKYMQAGANIITTNTFNSNSISMTDYGLDEIKDLVKRLNREGVLLVRKALEEYKNEENDNVVLIGGSVGPTNRSLSMSPDISDPLKRNMSFDELQHAYFEQIEGLIEGGIDLLICETFFDTLNLKACLCAANTVMKIKETNVPIMVSATVSDNAGRILSGQTLQAFVTTINDFDNVAVIGLNCGFGPDRMKKYLKEINKVNKHFTSCHPNAGLPDESGCYDINAYEFKENIKNILNERLLNIIGGCCGTTPEYIKEISQIIKEFTPKPLNEKISFLELSGLDRLECGDDFLVIGERCNVAGSAKFLRLIREGNYEEAASIAKLEIENGAKIIDINMDDALLDSEKEMVKFLRYILAEPEIAKVPFMIDSSKWEVIEKALKNIQGKGIVNSLSLKEGETTFIDKARKVKELGFALVVMAFDEKGQADSFERKIEICQRAYNLLIYKCNFPPQDIIFDVNIMTVGTGMPEHAKYAIDFIKATNWVKNNLPGTRTSGGVSNLSFAFRGKNKIREFMHTIFLHHAIKSGLDMAIVNPTNKIYYKEIPGNIKDVIENILFDKDADAITKLITIANEEIIENKNILKGTEPQKDLSISELLKEDLIKGDFSNIDIHLNKALKEMNDPVKIIEGPLLDGMKTVGDLFGEGKMFLPQVVKTARTMKKAVEILTPYINNSQKGPNLRKAGKIIIATVKGDVHDIGKNIVSTVLTCNNYDVIDLGIMVPAEKILEVTKEHNPDIICLSGLITPSLNEMVETVKLLDKSGIKIPIMVGGAATSIMHTALKIAPEYSGTVIHMTDASQNPIIANKILNRDIKEKVLNAIKEKQNLLRANKDNEVKILPFKEVIDQVKDEKRNNYFTKSPNIEVGKLLTISISLEEIIPLINWKMFFGAWKIQGNYIDKIINSLKEGDTKLDKNIITDENRIKIKEALQLFKTATKFLKDEDFNNHYDGKGIIKFEKASGDVKNIYIAGETFPMLRQQCEGTGFLSCSDFVGKNDDKNFIGLFAVTAGHYINNLCHDFIEKGDSYKGLVLQTLADRLVEASAEWLQKYICSNYWEVKIRPAWGYPMLPDQTMLLKTTKFLPFETIGISLTENGAMYPPASISGLYFSNPNSKYFMVGKIGEDQLIDYAIRRGLSLKEIKARLR